MPTLLYKRPPAMPIVARGDNPGDPVFPLIPDGSASFDPNTPPAWYPPMARPEDGTLVRVGDDVAMRTEQIGGAPDQRQQAVEALLALAKKQMEYEPPPPPEFQPAAGPRHPKIARVLNAFLAGFAATGDKGAQQAYESNMRQQQEREAAAQQDYQRRYQQWQTQVGMDQGKLQNGMAGLQAYMNARKMLEPDPQDAVAAAQAETLRRALDRPDIAAKDIPFLAGAFPDDAMLGPEMYDDALRAFVSGRSNERAAATAAGAQTTAANKLEAAENARRLEDLQEQAEDLRDRAYKAASLARLAKAGVQINEADPSASIDLARARGLLGGPITPDEVRAAWAYFPTGTMSFDDVVTLLNTRQLPGGKPMAPANQPPASSGLDWSRAPQSGGGGRATAR